MPIPQLALGLGGSLLQGIMGNSASRAQRRAAERQQAMFQQNLAQTRADLQPYMTLGSNALGRMAAVDAGDYSTFENAPDFVFARDEGMRALDRSAAARGSLFSGGAEADRMQFASGLASQNLQNYLGRMMSQAGMGQQAATNLGSFGAQMAGAQAGAIGAQGQARADGFGAWSNMLGDMAGGLGNYFGAKPGKPGKPGKTGGGVWGSQPLSSAAASLPRSPVSTRSRHSPCRARSISSSSAPRRRSSSA